MKLRAITSAIPQTVHQAEEIADWVGAEPDFLRDKVGVSERAFLAADETGVDLTAVAARRLLERTGVKIGEVDLLVFVTQTPDHAIPQNSSLLLARLDAPTHIASFDLSLGCSGYPYALVVAKSMLSAQGANRAIVVTCDPYSRIMNRHNRATTAVFGDGATATMIDAFGVLEISRADFGTDGTKCDALIIRKGHAATPYAGIHQPFPTYSEADADDYYLSMNGRAVFNFVMSEVPGSVHRALALAELELDDIDLFALHQGSLFMLKQLAAELQIPDEKLLVNIDRYGNTVSSSVPLLLEDVQNTQPEGFAGKRILISGFGVGLSWGSLVLSG
jgi:3-oxoacyl-[acyl-carrier-protein] synthase III